MNKESGYIKYLSENFKSNSEISPILDDYFYDKIDFNLLIDKITYISNKTVMNYNSYNFG